MLHLSLDIFVKTMQILREKLDDEDFIYVHITIKEAEQFERFLPKEIVWAGSRVSYTEREVTDRWVELDLERLFLGRTNIIRGSGKDSIRSNFKNPQSTKYATLDSFIKECCSIIGNPILPI